MPSTKELATYPGRNPNTSYLIHQAISDHLDRVVIRAVTWSLHAPAYLRVSRAADWGVEDAIEAVTGLRPIRLRYS